MVYPSSAYRRQFAVHLAHLSSTVSVIFHFYDTINQLNCNHFLKIILKRKFFV